MDGTKLDISGKPAKDPPSTTYKQISESDLEDQAIARSKANLKTKINGTEEEHEKMLPSEEDKVTEESNINSADVKFISNEKQNGDAKVDIGEIKAAFVGMGKEELMKYANDPFWVRLRWFLFILFWLIWAAMLIGAILIIVAAPKCSPPEPRTWWEEGPLTEIEPEATVDDLKQLKERGVQGVIVKWSEDTFVPINESTAFLDFLIRAKETKTNVVVDLKPGASWTWFDKSENRDDNGDFNDYYIWAHPKGDRSQSPREPNNWKSKKNISAWKFSSTRNQYYLSPDETPQLNFSNPKVVKEFSNVLSNFLAAGVKGVRLRGAPYLLVDPSLRDAVVASQPGYDFTDYGFYTHTNTEYRNELGGLVKEWRTIVKNKTDGDGPFMLSDSVIKNLDKFKVNNTLMIDLPSEPTVFGSNKQLSAGQIHSNIGVVFLLLENKYWPLWQHNSSSLPSDVLDTVTMLLPGTTLIDKNSDIPKELIKIRQSSSILHGNTTTYLLANNTIFAYGRLTPGNPGYLVAVNPTQERVIVNFPLEIPAISEEVTVQFFSKNYNETGIEIKKTTDAHQVPFSPSSAIVLSYVPQSKA